MQHPQHPQLPPFEPTRHHGDRYGHPAYGYAAPMPMVAPRNTIGVAGFVLGVVGLLFSFVPIIGVIAWPLVLVGLPLSVVGYRRARRGEAGDRGLSLAGIITGAIGLLICVVYVATLSAVDVPEFDTAPPPALQSEPYSIPDGPDAGLVAPPVTTPAPPPEPGTISGSGTFLVGDEIEPGTYRTAGADPADAIPNCYWSRLGDTSGELGSIIANDWPQDASSVVTIRSSDYAFETSGCQRWERVQ